MITTPSSSLGAEPFPDRILTQLQSEGRAVIRHSLVDGLRLTTLLGALNHLGIEPSDVVLHGTSADCIAVTVKP